jgi:hypothetical protein
VRMAPFPYAGITRVRFNGFAGKSDSRHPTSQVSLETTPRFIEV